MSENKYLNEEKYQKTKRVLLFVAILLFIVGLSTGSLLIYKGVAKPNQAKVEELSKILENKKEQLKAAGIQASSNYEDKDAYDLYIITNALDPSNDHCDWDEYINHKDTSEYCKLMKDKEWMIAPGIMIIMFSLSIGSMLLMSAKQREIMAFQAQQVMPVAKEGLDEMAPTFGKAAGEIAKDIKEKLDNDEK